MGGLDAIEWESCLLEPVRNREAERYLRRAIGIVPPGAYYFLDSPWVTRATATLDVSHIPLLHVSPKIAGLVSLVVSQDNSCRYCYAATRSIMKILGIPEARIRGLEENFLSADISEAEKRAMEFARCVSRATPMATCTEAAPLIEAGFSPDGVKEIAAYTAVNVFFNRVATLPALPSDALEELPQRWFVRLFRPLIARSLRPRRATRPEPLRPEQRQGPFAEIVNALDGLPAAPRLRAVIDDAFASTVLSRRVTALVFAVVARGLGCPLSEAEAVRLLDHEGVDAEAVNQVLAHLSGPNLDPSERAAAALARETIWYRSAQLQRYARSVRPLFTRQQFVELIGMAGLANALCRLSVAVDLARRASAAATH